MFTIKNRLPAPGGVKFGQAMTFGNRSVALHLFRGCVGFGALAAAVFAPISPWWSLGLVPLALVSLKGCPVCWTMGLFETISHRARASRSLMDADDTREHTAIREAASALTENPAGSSPSQPCVAV